MFSEFSCVKSAPAHTSVLELVSELHIANIIKCSKKVFMLYLFGDDDKNKRCMYLFSVGNRLFLPNIFD